MLGISSGSGLGISSGSGQGISSGSSQGISSGSGLGISSGSGQGISSGSSQGISSGSSLGISSGSGLGISSGSALGFISDSLVLGGPVSSVSMHEGSFTAMGQDVSAPLAILSALSVGDFVTVEGRISGTGTIDATAVNQTGELYTAGSSMVFVVGLPTSVDSKLGVATIGDLRVDYTQLLGGSDFNGIGAAIAVIGTQPALGGKMISSQVLDRTELFLRN